MRIAEEFWSDTSRTLFDSLTSETAENAISLRLTSSAEATLAKKTATLEERTTQETRRLAVSSSALLMNCARELFFVKIRQSFDQMPLGLGGSFDPSWNDLVTLCCPSSSGPVVLALTINGRGCCCSPKFRTPSARDWKGMSAKSWRDRTDGKDTEPTLADQIGGVPHPEFVEELMGFPIGYSALGASEIVSYRKSRNGSGEGS